MTTIDLDYPIHPRSRYEPAFPHPKLMDIIERSRSHYEQVIDSFAHYADFLRLLPMRARDEDLRTPYWDNGYIPGMDALAIYAFVASRRPSTYLEIGSGNSTKFARRAIEDHHLHTKIISIDPQPRAEIDVICDQLLRIPLEEADLDLFYRLSPGDIVFVDGSHRCYMNSDATVFFLDVLPYLANRVLVGIHDIWLPYDYPAEWISRYYSEQYLLACYLLSESRKIHIEFPCMFATYDQHLQTRLGGIWAKLPAGVMRSGAGMWLSTEFQAEGSLR